MNRVLYVIMFCITFGCSTDKLDNEATLEDSLTEEEVVLDNVIACAASNKDDDLVSVFFYPRDGASDIRYYETADAGVDKNNFENYYHLESPTSDLFNGYLKKFEVSVSNEKWVIVSFKEAGKIHLSNPIRLKQLRKPTEYFPQNIAVDSTTSAMPIFSWQDGNYNDTKIYFQVVSDAQKNLLSGTYTFDKTFQYYDTDNVVLNITKGTPDTLKANSSYGFTLMGVSEDNWVNLFAEIDFKSN